MKRKALLISLSSKVKDQEIILVDKIELTEAKTKKMFEIFNNFKEKTGKDLSKGTLIVQPKSDRKISLSSRNIPKTKVVRADNLSPLEVLSYRYLLILSPKETVEIIGEKYQI